MKKVIEWLIYLTGLIVIVSFIHECYHYSLCGGEFASGFGFIKGEMLSGGLTWCATENSAGGELIPSLMEILLVLGGVGLKARKSL